VTAPKPAQRRPRGSVKEREISLFLEALCEGWSVTHAADRADRHRRRFYDLRDTSEEFAAAWDEAVEAGTQALEDEARRRAVDGWDEPVYQHGELAGTVRKYSDQLLTFLLKGRRPEKYREGATVELKQTVNELHIAPDPERTARVLAKLQEVGLLTHVPEKHVLELPQAEPE
jgi:hypothetical protein